MKHEKIERNVGLMGVLILAVISVAGLVEIVPLATQAQIIEPSPGIEPHGPLELAGRDVYVREGCYLCHSQQIRPFRAETRRYGHYSLAGESVYERPFQWGSKRTGPDLARVGGRYSDEWHRVHMLNPRDVVPESNMPAFPWLASGAVDPGEVARHMRALRTLGHPYTDAQIDGVADVIGSATEMDAVIAYLQSLGTNIGRNEVPQAAQRPDSGLNEQGGQ